MILTFYRRIIRNAGKDQESPVIAKIIMADGERQTTLGSLNFPNQTTWAKFFGSIQTGALRIKDLTVVMENAKEDVELIAKELKPTATTKMVVGIGVGAQAPQGGQAK